MLHLLPFRPITLGRLRRARQTSFGVFAVALVFYLLTLDASVFPGESARWTVWVTGINTRELVSHPLLSALGRVVASLPVFSLAFRLNALAALAGAMTLGWIYRLAWFFVFDTMREQSAITKASRLARFAGFLAVLTVGLSRPFWHAATNFRPEIFDVALLMGCAHLLIVYARTERVVWLLLFGVLYGMGIAESPLFMAMIPLMAAVAVLVEWRLTWCQMKRLIASAELALLAFAGTYYLSAWAFAKMYDRATNAQMIFGMFPQMLRVQFSAISQMLPAQLWLPVVLMGLVATALSFLAASYALDNRRSWSLLLLNVGLSVSAVLLLGNAPFAPWSIQVARDVLPVATYVLAGLGISLLATSWRALALMGDPVEENQALHEKGARAPRHYAATRMAGFLLAPVLALAIGVCGVVNAIEHLKDNGRFADRMADAVLDGLHGRTWVVGNGIIDNNLLIRAHERGLTIHLLAPLQANERHYVASILRAVRADPTLSANARLRAESLMAYNFLVFLDDMFATDSRVGAKAIAMGLPDMWYGSRWIPVPEVLFCGGVRDLSELQDRNLLAAFQTFWKQWSSFLKDGPGSPQQVSYRCRQTMLRHLAFMANNLGVILDDLGRHEEAYLAYQKAHSINPENISALLNLFEMVSRGMHPEAKNQINSELRSRVDDPTRRYSLWSLSRYYGYVRNSEMFVQMGWSWALSSNPGSVLAGLRSVYAMQPDESHRMGVMAMLAALHEMRGDLAQSADEYQKVLQADPRNATAISGLVRLTLRRNVVDEARRILETGEGAGASKRLLRQDWAALYLVSGDLPRARIVLQDLADDPAVTPMCLAMLAMVMIEQNEGSIVESTVLPKLLQKTNDSKDDRYFPLVIQGRIWQSKGKSGFKNALIYFQRAAAIRPDVQALQEVILMLDAAMENQTAAEAHALLLLRQQPGHALANFIVGSIRLEQARYEDAEPYLRCSAGAPAPTVDALNNFAQVLCHNRKLDEATLVARRATEIAPGRYESWSTLASVLILAGNFEAAEEALAKAHQMNNADSRLFLVDAQLAVQRGDLGAARKALGAIDSKTTLSISERRDLADLKAALDRLGQRRL